jgi:Bacterial inner membrane protein
VSELIGWLATAIFAVSYFVRDPASMRRVQAGAALCWIVYGILLHARPVIAANVIVASLAIFSAGRTFPRERPEES